MSILISTSLEALPSPSPALPHRRTPCNGACWICLGLPSSWLSRDLRTDTSLSTCHFHRGCKASSEWRKQLQEGQVATVGKLNIPTESWDPSFLWHQLSASLGLAVASLLGRSVGLWQLWLHVPSCSPPFVKCKFTGVLWRLNTLMFAKHYYYRVLKSLRGS